jgi:hypothetical protein
VTRIVTPIGQQEEKFMKQHARIWVIASVLAPSVALAELPKPVADMECLVGRWKGKGTLKRGADAAAPATAASVLEVSLGK